MLCHHCNGDKLYVLFITPTKKILDAFTLEVNYCDAARGYVIQLCDTYWQLWDPVCQDMSQEWQVVLVALWG